MENFASPLAQHASGRIVGGQSEINYMKITRDTMRADGQTVGESMQKDAAFLRSVGIQPKTSMLPDEESEMRRDDIRTKVLDALDCVLGGKGWVDSDLPPLFKAIDAHILAWEKRQ